MYRACLGAKTGDALTWRSKIQVTKPLTKVIGADSHPLKIGMESVMAVGSPRPLGKVAGLTLK